MGHFACVFERGVSGDEGAAEILPCGIGEILADTLAGTGLDEFVVAHRAVCLASVAGGVTQLTLDILVHEHGDVVIPRACLFVEGADTLELVGIDFERNLAHESRELITGKRIALSRLWLAH